MEEEKKLTGYPSIDKPWLKYYSDDIIHAPLPSCTIYEYLVENNCAYPKDIAIHYLGRRITYGELFQKIDATAASFAACSAVSFSAASLAACSAASFSAASFIRCIAIVSPERAMPSLFLTSSTMYFDITLSILSKFLTL